MSSGVLLAPLTVALALGVSGVAKLRSGVPTDAAFESLRVPRALRQPLVVRGLPWLEVGLAVTLLLVPHPLSVVVTAVALLLMLAYLVLVLAAVVRRDDVDCHCFGGLTSGRVTGATAVRNVLLVAATGWAFVDALGGHSFVQRLGDLTSPDLAWAAGAVLLAGTAALVVWPGRTDEPEVAPLPPVDEDGQRRGIPFIELTDAAGAVTSLPALAVHRPVLVVSLSPLCDSCAEVTAVIATWPALVPELDVRVVTGAGLGPLPEWPGEVLVDLGDQLRLALGMHRPSALLLGADALVAAGPVVGPVEVLALFEDVREDLEAMRSAQQS
jgi:hypothetical protein